MGKSPGHEKWPDHKVEESEVARRLQAAVGDKIIAESTHVVRVAEDGHPDRYYFPRDDVVMDALRRTSTTTECPFKGTARYLTISADGHQFTDAAWSYEEPYDEHELLKGYIAFADDKISEIKIGDAV